MKFITLVSCLLLAAFIGPSLAQNYRRPAEPSRYHPRRPYQRPNHEPCGSNGLGDYKGGCDISVPVIVMPKGRPIMERVLDWFNCGTELCRPSEPTPTTTAPSDVDEYPPEDDDEPSPEDDSPTTSSTPPGEEPVSSPPSMTGTVPSEDEPVAPTTTATGSTTPY